MSYPHRAIRSFVLRQGRLTKGQHYALEHFWSQYGIEQAESKLNFSTLFQREAPITLEIGFGNGDSLATMAKAAPERNFLGIEVHRPGVGRLLHLINEYELSNLRVIHDDAVDVLRQRLPKHSIDTVQLFFPDPWHKRRHHKRRLVQPEFIQLIHSLLTVNGILHLATDWEEYALHMSHVMQATHHFKNMTNTLFATKPKSRPLTKFENRGLKLGHGVWDLLYKSL